MQRPTPGTGSPLEKLGAAIRKRREAKGLKQVEVAELAESADRVIGGIERGERNISVLHLFYVAAALETTPAELLRDVTIEDLRALPPKPGRRPGRR